MYQTFDTTTSQRCKQRSIFTFSRNVSVATVFMVRNHAVLWRGIGVKNQINEERRQRAESGELRGRAFNIRETQRYFSLRGRWTDILNTEGNVKRYLDGD